MPQPSPKALARAILLLSLFSAVTAGPVATLGLGLSLKAVGNATDASLEDGVHRPAVNPKNDPYHYSDLGSPAASLAAAAHSEVQRFRRSFLPFEDDLIARSPAGADDDEDENVFQEEWLVIEGKLVKNPKYVQNPKYKQPPNGGTVASGAPPGCFPNNQMSLPASAATASSLKSWWCDQSVEYGFMGFSYPVSQCQSRSELTSDFQRMKSQYSARYVRIYGTCDNSGFQNDLVEAAWSAGLGIYSLVWFGWDAPDAYKGRMASLVNTIKSNPKAPYVIRNVAVGSEPLFDWALSPSDLAATILNLKSQLSQYGMQITISEMPWGFQLHNMAWPVLNAIDIVEANILPFFDSQASWGSNAWGVFSWSVGFFQTNAPGKIIRATQTGWPSNDSVWKANSPNAVASVASEKAYFDLLDSKCESYMKPNRVGWFAHTYTDTSLPGWGVLNSNKDPKFPFKPRTTC